VAQLANSPYSLSPGGASNAVTGTGRNTLAWIILVALTIRLIASALLVAGYAASWANDGVDHWTFAYETGRVARSLATGHGFSDPLKVPSGPTAWLPPVYPLILAGVFKIFGVYSTDSAMAIRVFNSVVSSLICLPIFFIARSLSKRMGLWAAGAWALFPHSVWAASAIVWDCSLSALILCCLVWFTLDLQNDRPMSAWAGYGVLWGIGELTNATMLAALPFLLGWLWLRQHSLRKARILRPAVTILACLTVMGPWLARNDGVFHKPFLIKSNLWLEFAVGNGVGQWSYTITAVHPDHSPSALRDFVERGEMGFMAEKKRQAIDFLRDHPALYFWLCLRRFIYVWTGFWSVSHQFLASGTDGGLRHIALTTAYSFPLLLGLRRAFCLEKNLALLFAAVFFSVPFVTYLTHPFGYYRYLIDPLIVVLAVYGIVPLLLWTERNLPVRTQRWVSAFTVPK
jgi:4-amino-4-deoxy-L-arabinose transferase-like glycosyltransferase